jgi:hypothetical protein
MHPEDPRCLCKTVQMTKRYCIHLTCCVLSEITSRTAHDSNHGESGWRLDVLTYVRTKNKISGEMIRDPLHYHDAGYQHLNVPASQHPSH